MVCPWSGLCARGMDDTAHTPESVGLSFFGHSLIRPFRGRRRLAAPLSLLRRVARVFSDRIPGFVCVFPGAGSWVCGAGFPGTRSLRESGADLGRYQRVLVADMLCRRFLRFWGCVFVL